MGIGVAVMAATSCGSTQYAVSTPGENLSALTKITDADYLCEHPFGGDNGRNLFFSMRDKNGSSSNIYKKDNPISASVTMKTSGKNQNMAPTYCEAIDKVAFSGRQEGGLNRDIYMVSGSEGNALSVVTTTPGEEENYPCLSRDGRSVVFEKRQTLNSPTDTEIWSKNLQTGELVMLSIGRTPSYSPDGQTITFVKYTDDGENTCLWTMSSDGSNQMRLTDVNMGIVANPRFSPDGRKIVFQCSKEEKEDYDLYVIERSGNNITQLTINKSFDGEPYWANDGNIYFTSDRGGDDGNYQIWRFKFGGATSTSTSTTTKTVTYQDTTHKVVRGETITQIAQKYGVSVRDIVQWNGLRSMTLTPGMTLKVSAP